VRIYLSSPERELSLFYLVEQDIFSTHSRAQIQAVQATVLLMAPRATIERELGRYPALQFAVIRVLAMALNRTMTVIEDLSFHQVRGRIARYLLRLAERKKAPLLAGCVVRLELGMEEIAALLGTTRQTASTELNAMIKAGVVERHGRSDMAILDPARLAGWADEKVTVSQLTDRNDVRP
jgi:CRP-like cAMP-binding protein